MENLSEQVMLYGLDDTTEICLLDDEKTILRVSDVFNLIVEYRRELKQLKKDAFISENHNAGVIDRIIEQLRDAGYTGTLSHMIDSVLENLADLEVNAARREGYIAGLEGRLGDVNSRFMPIRGNAMRQMESDFFHFLSYSGLFEQPQEIQKMLYKAFYAAWEEPKVTGELRREDLGSE